MIIAKGFLCTGTLIAPDTVLTAGHCGSITGGAGVATPAAYPPQAFDVYIGSNKPGQGEKVPVSKVTANPNYLLNDGYDITILKLSRNSTKAPTPVSGAAEESCSRPRRSSRSSASARPPRAATRPTRCRRRRSRS